MSTTQTIRTIIAEQPNAVEVFERFQIDLCMQADQSLEAACRSLQLSYDQIVEKLEEARAIEKGSAAIDPVGWTLTRLIQQIVRIHHQNVRRELPQLAQMAQKLASKHGDRTPELKRIERLSNQFLDRELTHLRREEQELFPIVARMEEDLDVLRPQPNSCAGMISRSVHLMRQDHKANLGIMAEIRSLTNGFSAPIWACPIHRALFNRWRDFEKDFKQHIHLENDYLFPRVLQLGRELSVGR